MATGQGYLSYLQIGREATWGTAVAATKRWPVKSFSVKPVVGVIQPTWLDGSPVQPPSLIGGKAAMLTVTFPVAYTNQLLLFDLIMGTNTYGSNGGASTGSGDYTHTWTTFKNLCNSFTVQVGTGDIPTTKVERLVGMKPVSATFHMSSALDTEEQVLMCTLEMIGKQVASTITPTSLSNSPVDFVQMAHMTVNTNHSGSTAVRTIDWELKIETGIAQRLFLEGLGFVSEPQRNARPKTTLTITEEFQAITAFDAYLAGTVTDIQTTFESSLVFSIDFQFDGRLLENADHSVDDEGFVQQKLVIGSDGVSGGTLAVVVENQQATITT